MKSRIVINTVLLYVIMYTALVISCGLVYGPPVAFKLGMPLNILSFVITAFFLMGWIQGGIDGISQIKRTEPGIVKRGKKNDEI